MYLVFFPPPSSSHQQENSWTFSRDLELNLHLALLLTIKIMCHVPSMILPIETIRKDLVLVYYSSGFLLVLPKFPGSKNLSRRGMSFQVQGWWLWLRFLRRYVCWFFGGQRWPCTSVEHVWRPRDSSCFQHLEVYQIPRYHVLQLATSYNSYIIYHLSRDVPKSNHQRHMNNTMQPSSIFGCFERCLELRFPKGCSCKTKGAPWLWRAQYLSHPSHRVAGGVKPGFSGHIG